MPVLLTGDFPGVSSNLELPPADNFHASSPQGSPRGVLESLSSFRSSLLQSQRSLLAQLDTEMEKVRQRERSTVTSIDRFPSLTRDVVAPSGDPVRLSSSSKERESFHSAPTLPGCLEEETSPFQGEKAWKARANFSTLHNVEENGMKHMPWNRKTVAENDLPIAAISRKEKQEAEKDAEERFGASQAFAKLTAEAASKSVRKTAFSNFVQPEDVQTERCFVKVVKHPCFERVAMAATLLNAIWIPIDMEFNAEIGSAPEGFVVIENIFVVVFSLELFLRFMAFSKCCIAAREPSFLFDTFLVSIMVLETWLIPLVTLLSGGAEGGTDVARSASILRVARIMRVLRTARVAKLVRYMPELIILLKGILFAFRPVFFTIVLLVLITLIFSVAITEVSRGADLPALLFSSMSSTLLSLLVQCIMPDLESSFKQVAAENWLVGVLWLLFIVFASYIVLGLLVGVLVETVSTVASIEREQLDVDFAQKVLWEMIDKGGADEDGDNCISELEYAHLLSRPQAAKALTVLGVDMTAALDYGSLLFEDGEPLTFAEFMQGMLTLRGSNHTTVKDIVDLRKFTADEFSQLQEVLLEMSKFLASQGMPAAVVQSLSDRVQRSRATRIAKSRRYPK